MHSLIELPIKSDLRGNLCVIESEQEIGFAIERVYYLYDVPSQSSRAGHAHYKLRQLLVAGSGSFDVRLHDGTVETKVTLNRPDRGLLIGPMTWRDIDNFSSGALCLVLASAHYDEADYMRDFDDFMRVVRS